jgi:hypothetical protein
VLSKLILDLLIHQLITPIKMKKIINNLFIQLIYKEGTRNIYWEKLIVNTIVLGVFFLFLY